MPDNKLMPDLEEYPDEIDVFEVRRGLKRITPLLPLVREGLVVIAGGFARYMVSPLIKQNVAAPGDVDLFCTSVEAYDEVRKALSKMGATQTTSGLLYTTYSVPDMTDPVQLITPAKSKFADPQHYTYGNPIQVISRFDFSVCQFALIPDEDAEEGFVILGSIQGIADERNQFLRIVNDLGNPLRPIMRAQKYIRRGYFMPLSQYVLMFDKWKSADGEFYKKTREWTMGMIENEANAEEWAQGELTFFVEEWAIEATAFDDEELKPVINDDGDTELASEPNVIEW